VAAQSSDDGLILKTREDRRVSLTLSGDMQCLCVFVCLRESVCLCLLACVRACVATSRSRRCRSTMQRSSSRRGLPRTAASKGAGGALRASQFPVAKLAPWRGLQSTSKRWRGAASRPQSGREFPPAHHQIVRAVSCSFLKEEAKTSRTTHQLFELLKGRRAAGPDLER